jgi:hypothetical protein
MTLAAQCSAPHDTDNTNANTNNSHSLSENKINQGKMEKCVEAMIRI